MTRLKPAFLIILTAAAVFSFFLYFSEIIGFINDLIRILSPFIVGITVAFLLNTPMAFFEKYLFRKLPFKFRRLFSMSLSYLILIGIITILISVIIPIVADSVVNISETLPDQINRISSLITGYGFNVSFESLGITSKITEWFSSSFFEDFLPSVMTAIWNIVFTLAGFVVSAYLLYSKEKALSGLRKTLYFLFPSGVSDGITAISKDIYAMLNKFINGQLIDSIIFGIAMYIALLIFGIPYAVLIALIAAITNVIPMVGPFIGAVPSALIILTVSPVKMFIFIAITIVLQQIDGNIINPKIVGGQIGLHPFWLLFAITIGGGIFGVGGILVTIPLFAVFYSVAKRFCEKKLTKKDLPVSTLDDLYSKPYTP